MSVSRIGRTPRHEHERRRKQFVIELARTNDPVEAARLSGHPAERALETLRDLGFVLTTLSSERNAA